MSVEHSTITDPNVHEPKGASTASSGEVYVSDGAGSGSWQDLLSGVNNLNTFDVVLKIDDLSTPLDRAMFVLPRDGTLTTIRTVIDGAIATSDATISIYDDGVLKGQTLTIATSGSADGITDTLTLTPTYSFTAGDVVTLETDGASTNAVSAYCTLTFTAD